MKICGIIAEYDPFHNGHAYHIAKTRAQGAEAVVVVLGGEFTQRGEPAYCSKFFRTKCALLSGADLVLEMPLPYAVGSAEKFAEGGIRILDALGCVDMLSFGSETGDAEKILRYAEISDGADFLEKVKEYQKEGITAPAAREKAVEELCPDLAQLAENPNDTLGAEYCKWLLRLESKITPFAVKRRGAAHDEIPVLKSGFAPASYLRGFTYAEDILPFLPHVEHELIMDEYNRGALPLRHGRYDIAALSRLRMMSEEELSKVPDAAAEGLYHRLYDAIRQSKDIAEVWNRTKTKRYTMSRIKRITAGAVLGLDSTVLKGSELPYIHVLGMNETGAAVLSLADGICPLPVSTSLAELAKTSETARLFAEYESRAEDLWQLCLPVPGECGKAFTEKVCKI